MQQIHRVLLLNWRKTRIYPTTIRETFCVTLNIIWNTAARSTLLPYSISIGSSNCHSSVITQKKEIHSSRFDFMPETTAATAIKKPENLKQKNGAKNYKQAKCFDSLPQSVAERAIFVWKRLQLSNGRAWETFNFHNFSKEKQLSG